MPLPSVGEVATEFVDLLSEFIVLGAIGFRATGWRRVVPRVVWQRTAALGLVAILVSTFVWLDSIAAFASSRHVSMTSILGQTQFAIGAVLLAVTLVGFALAAGHRALGWCLAAGGALGGVLGQPIVQAIRRARPRVLVMPIHALAAGLWLGALFCLVVAGLAYVLRSEPREQRGAIAAELVNGFSPLALVCGLVVVITGTIAAVRHVKKLSALWTTTYGRTLSIKLVFVAAVFALGAWNWRRRRPQLGAGRTEEAARALRRSAIAELGLAAIVLVVTSVLVSI